MKYFPVSLWQVNANLPTSYPSLVSLIIRFSADWVWNVNQLNTWHLSNFRNSWHLISTQNIMQPPRLAITEQSSNTFLFSQNIISSDVIWPTGTPGQPSLTITRTSHSSRKSGLPWLPGMAWSELEIVSEFCYCKSQGSVLCEVMI